MRTHLGHNSHPHSNGCSNTLVRIDVNPQGLKCSVDYYVLSGYGGKLVVLTVVDSFVFMAVSMAHCNLQFI